MTRERGVSADGRIVDLIAYWGPKLVDMTKDELIRLRCDYIDSGDWHVVKVIDVELARR